MHFKHIAIGLASTLASAAWGNEPPKEKTEPPVATPSAPAPAPAERKALVSFPHPLVTEVLY